MSTREPVRADIQWLAGTFRFKSADGKKIRAKAIRRRFRQHARAWNRNPAHETRKFHRLLNSELPSRSAMHAAYRRKKRGWK